MAIKKYKPTSPGRRGGTVIDYSGLSKVKPEKSLLKPIKKTGGRNSNGRITSRRRGGGNKRHYRMIDFKRNKDNIPAIVASIEYDPNRSPFIALLHYADGEKRYILAPDGLQVGEELMSGDKTEFKPGNCMPLANMPLGQMVHNIEMYPGRGGQLVRSAGMSAQFLAREGGYAFLVLPSGEQRKIRVECRATLGRLSNGEHSLVKLGKAGRNRHRGRRPKVRGVAQNPIAHPMGGGEGRSSGGRVPCSPWGKVERKTRNPRKTTSKLIVRRRTKRKR
ncbi:50S ribosomal protein L2 [Planctomycetota bacterium]